MIFESARGSFDFFNFRNTFIIYFLIELAVSGFISISTRQVDSIALDPVMFKDYYFKSLLASLLGITFFQLGYLFSGKKRLKIPSALISPWRPTNSLFLARVYFLVGFLSFSLFLIVNGGLSQFLTDIEVFRAGGISGQGILLYPSTQLLIIGVLIYFLNGIKNNTKWSNKRVAFISVILLIIALLPTLIIGFRSLLLLPILQFLVIWNYAYKKIHMVKLIPVGLIFIGIFITYGIIREIPSQANISVEQALEVVSEKPELAYSAISRTKGTEVVASVIKKLEETGNYDLGYKSFFETITIFIPTVLWPNKPVASSVRFTTFFFGEDLAYTRGYDRESWGGVSPTVIGEFFWHFGWFGVSIGMFVMGWIFSKLYKTFIANKEKMSILLIYAVLFPICSMMAESVQGYINSSVLNFISVGFSLFILRLNFSK